MGLSVESIKTKIAPADVINTDSDLINRGERLCALGPELIMIAELGGFKARSVKPQYVNELIIELVGRGKIEPRFSVKIGNTRSSEKPVCVYDKPFTNVNIDGVKILAGKTFSDFYIHIERELFLKEQEILDYFEMFLSLAEEQKVQAEDIGIRLGSGIIPPQTIDLERDLKPPRKIELPLIKPEPVQVIQELRPGELQPAAS